MTLSQTHCASSVYTPLRDLQWVDTINFGTEQRWKCTNRIVDDTLVFSLFCSCSAPTEMKKNPAIGHAITREHWLGVQSIVSHLQDIRHTCTYEM